MGRALCIVVGLAWLAGEVQVRGDPESSIQTRPFDPFTDHILLFMYGKVASESVYDSLRHIGGSVGKRSSSTHHYIKA